jgi:hypothetical protein
MANESEESASDQAKKYWQVPGHVKPEGMPDPRACRHLHGRLRRRKKLCENHQEKQRGSARAAGELTISLPAGTDTVWSGVIRVFEVGLWAKRGWRAGRRKEDVRASVFQDGGRRISPTR